ncbi:MAG: hypothetical protein JNL74_11555, partial [Fibrobacteres bacterium]|nr:hypothetical protein [Fibrobacterota bacterium]
MISKLTLVISALALFSSAFEVTRSIDRTSVQIGEPLVLTINIDRKPEDKLIYPGPGTSFGDFDLKDMRTEVENKNGRVIEHKQYQLQVFKLGQGVIPQLKVLSATDTADYKLTDSVTIIVKSALTAADTVDIDDIYAPVSLPLGTSFWVTFFGVLAALVLALFLFDY